MTAVVVAIIAAVIGLLTYVVQDVLNRRSALKRRRQTLYEGLVRDLFELLVAKTGPERSKFITRVEKSWLFASDDVLAACYGFLDTYDTLSECAASEATDVLTIVRSNSQIRGQVSEIFAKIFLAMRKEIRRSKISAAWAQQKVRLYAWGIISRSEPDDAQSSSR